MKRCRKCCKSLPLAEFRVDHHHVDGRYSWCKQCQRDRMLELREASQCGHGSEYRQPEIDDGEIDSKIRARAFAESALRAGTLKKAAACQSCGGRGNLGMRQDDVSHPLQVRWLCPACGDKLQTPRRRHHG